METAAIPMKRAVTVRQFEKASGTLSERTEGALAKLSLAAQVIHRREALAHGLSPCQAQILAFLAREGTASVSRLAARLALTPATVSDSVAALARRGFVRVDKCAEDRRRVAIVPTARGRRAGAALATWPDVLRNALRGTAPAEQRVLFRVLIRIILRLLATGVIQESRMCLTCVYFRPWMHRGARRPHHCALANVPLMVDSLRLDCPDHVQGRSAARAAALAGRVLGLGKAFASERR
jgi:DNA-binding MarR family transcriptional regulator